MKFTPPVRLFLAIVAVSMAAALAHVAVVDTFDLPALVWHG